MNVKETRGHHVPICRVVQLSNADMLSLNAESVRRSMRDANRSDAWGRGGIADAHLVGLMAEYALELLVEPDESTRSLDTYDAGHDLVINGLRVDVKATTGQEVKIRCDHHARKRPDVYVFSHVHIKKHVVTFWGWATRAEFEAQAKSTWSKFADSVALDQVHMNDMDKLLSTTNIIRYPGGKSKLLDAIERYLPRRYSLFGDDLPSSAVDLFSGSGVVTELIARRLGGSVQVIANDIDRDLIAILESVRDQPDELISQLVKVNPSVELWERAKREDNTDGSVVQRAVRKIVLHRLSHAGIGYKAGTAQGGKQQKSKYPVGCRWNVAGIAHTIRAWSKTLQGVKTFSLPFQDVPLTQDDWVFADPPYVDAGKSLYRVAFEQQEHVELRNRLIESRCQFLVTYDDHPIVRELYQRWCKIDEVKNSASNHTTKTELFITRA